MPYISRFGDQGYGMPGRLTPREEWTAVRNLDLYGGVIKDFPLSLGADIAPASSDFAARMKALTDSMTLIQQQVTSTAVHLPQATIDVITGAAKETTKVATTPVGGVPVWVWVLGLAGVGGAIWWFTSQKPAKAAA